MTATEYSSTIALQVTEELQVAKTLIMTSKTNGSTPDENGKTQEHFILEDDCFVDLQAYLTAGTQLPDNEALFRLTYPEAMFKQYISRDDQTPQLYDYMVMVLTGISHRCTNFQAKTMNSMMLLAGTIAHFSFVTTDEVEKLKTHFEIILEPSVSLANGKFRIAGDRICEILEELSKRAQELQDDCSKMQLDLSQFQTHTAKDYDHMRKISDRSSIVLPKPADLDTEMRVRVDASYQTINDLAGNEWRAKSAFGGSPIYIGMVTGVGEKYENVFKAAREAADNAAQFREQCKNLRDSIQNIHETIGKAISALNEMMGVFGKMQVKLKALGTELKLSKSKLTAEDSDLRQKVLENLERCKQYWITVREKAAEFENKGLDAKCKLTSRPMAAEPEPRPRIVSVNYGGNNVTHYAKYLFDYGDCIRIRSDNPGFRDPWIHHRKTFAVLYQVGEKQRIFACRDRTGDACVHTLGSSANIDDERLKDAEVFEIPLMGIGAPAESKIIILAIVYGGKVIRQQSVYDYCYDRVNNGSIGWFNEHMGGDPWYQGDKTGVVFYQVKGSNEVKQCAGQELSWTALTV